MGRTERRGAILGSSVPPELDLRNWTDGRLGTGFTDEKHQIAQIGPKWPQVDIFWSNFPQKGARVEGGQSIASIYPTEVCWQKRAGTELPPYFRDPKAQRGPPSEVSEGKMCIFHWRVVQNQSSKEQGGELGGKVAQDFG